MATLHLTSVSQNDKKMKKQSLNAQNKSIKHLQYSYAHPHTKKVANSQAKESYFQ